MRFRRRKDADRVITGGVFVVQPDADGVADLAPVVITYAKPDPRALLDVANDVQTLAARMRRYQIQLQRYQLGEVDGEPPRLTITEDALAPLLDFERQHIIDVSGLVDEFSGAPIEFDTLEPGELDDVLIACGLDVVIDLYRAIEACNGLAEEQRARLAQYLEIRHLQKGCSCSVCDGDADWDDDCCYNDLRPLGDVYWLLDQWSTYSDADATGRPRWLNDIKRELDLVRIEVEKKEDDRRKQAELYQQHFGG